MHVPDDPPDRCPACGAAYESVSRHADGFVVNLLDNERYRRVCFRPATDGGGAPDADSEGAPDADSEAGNADPALDCYHHTHRQAGGSAVDSTDSEAPTDQTDSGVEPGGGS